MKVSIIFEDYLTNGKVRMIDSIELKNINKHLEDDTRIVDEFEIEKRTDMRVVYSNDDRQGMLAEIEDVTNKNKKQITDELLEQFAEGVNEGWLDAKQLGGLQMFIQNKL